VSKFRTFTGDVLQLGAELGKGGEGTVYSIQNRASQAAKIYLAGLAAGRAEKISKMVAAKLYVSASSVAYPVDIVLDGRGVFCGFTMQKMSGRRPAHQLYSPHGRKAAFPKATFPMLVRTTSNIAKSMANVHSAGCIIGDVNHSGVLVADDATVVLIDTDSFQFTYGKDLYGCKVGVAEFTPPELQGKNLSSIVRTTNHDNFGLAVLIFSTLMMGRHPFAGRYLGQGDMPMERAIAEYRFAYSSRRSTTLMEAPPNVPTLADLPASVGDAFERAFGPSGSAGLRVSPSEWGAILEKAEGDLVRCATSPAHHYFRVARSCPWCRMEQAYPGFQAFVPTFPTHAGAQPLNLGQLIAVIAAVKDPGPAPDLVASMPLSQRQKPSTDWSKIKRMRFKRWMGGTLGIILSLYLFTSPLPGLQIIALCILLISGVFGFLPPAPLKVARMRNRAAESTWNEARRTFEKSAGNSYLNHARQQANNLIAQLQETDKEEARKIADLTSRKREIQLRNYLDNHDIDQVKIKGIGNARKLTLKSYGIETAADIEYARIISINGFGSATAQSLVDWKEGVKAGFRFDPTLSINPADVSAIKATIALQRIDLEARARQAVHVLQKAATDIASVRANPGREAIDAWTAWTDAREFERDIRPSNRDLLTLGAAGMASAVSLFSLSNVMFVVSPYLIAMQHQVENTSATTSHSVDTLRSGSDGQVTSQLNSLPPAAAQSSESKQTAPLQNPTDAVVSKSESTPLEDADRAALARATPPEPAPITSPKEAVIAPGNVADPLHDPLTSSGASWIQNHLRDLGYSIGDKDGVWGPNSRSTLHEFKTRNGLPADEVWDTPTEAKLNAFVQTKTDQTFEGTWAQRVGDCEIGGSAANVKISRKGAIAKATNCDFRRIWRETQGWHVQGLCYASGRKWVADIHLSVVGNTLVWSSERGTATYYRCQSKQ
jgi:DNA-binding helix-hairpin-helix protein with protein kinase domain